MGEMDKMVHIHILHKVPLKSMVSQSIVVPTSMSNCYDRFSSPVGTENRDGSEVEEILTIVHRGFGGCTHRCAGKPKHREKD